MNGRQHERQDPPSQGAGQCQSELMGKQATAPSVARTCPHVKPQVIPVASGTAIVWAAVDGIYTLAHVLVERGLVADDDRLTEAIWTAWLQMAEASYLTAKDRAAWPDLGEVE